MGNLSKDNPHTLVGIIEIMDINQKVNAVTIGYFFAEEHWGKGIATEAVSTLVKFLFEEIDINRIQAEVMPANEVSKKSCRKMVLSKKDCLDKLFYGLAKELLM